VGPFIGACGGGGGEAGPSASSSSGGAPKTGGDLRVGLVGGSAKDTLDPHIAAFEPDICIEWQLYDNLLHWDDDFQMQNRLAEEVSANSNANVWTARLKPDLVWHDGSPVTADDVVFTFRRILDPKDPKAGAPSLVGLDPGNVVKKDDLTVEFRLDEPNAIFDEALASRLMMIVPVGFDPNDPVGCGPFTLDTFTPGEQISFLPFSDYWGDGPYVDSLTVIEFADDTARVNALVSGTVEAVSQLPRSQVKVIEAAGGFAVLNAETGGFQPFTMRVDQKPFDDVRVRQAFFLISDRPQMIEQAYGGFGWVGNDIYGPFDPGYPKDVAQREQDLERARSLLKAAGHDGLTVELVTSTSVGAGAVEAAQVFAENAKGAGVTVNVRKVDSGVMWGDDYLSWTFSQSFYYTRNYIQQAEQCMLPGAPFNETHWEDKRWQGIVAEARRTVDATKRNELIADAAKIQYEEGGYMIWSFNNQVDAFSQKLGGVKPSREGAPLGAFQFHNWYFA
jgi:peptide/nickel transport system substrate-binding protein